MPRLSDLAQFLAEKELFNTHIALQSFQKLRPISKHILATLRLLPIMGDANLFSDTFQITDINAQKYDRVARLTGHTEDGATSLTLDVNTELFPCAVNDRLQILLASTLALDGSKDDGKGWRDIGRGEASVADEYDYVCHGKLYRFEEGDDENM